MPWMPGRSYGGVLPAVVILAAVSACGTPSERRQDATAAVTRFQEALAAGQEAVLCAELAPGTREELEQSARRPCSQAVGREELPAAGTVRHVDVYGDQARVILDHDTLFLGHYPAGWKVTAADCEPRRQQPYQCEIKGG